MTSLPLQSDQTMWHTLRTRRRRVQTNQGLDAFAYRWISRAKHARVNLSFLKRQAEQATGLQQTISNLTDVQLNDRMAEVRRVFALHQHTDEHVPQAMALVGEVAYRETGQRPYPVQLMGALGLFHGQIVEMVTGEGKTLTASVASAVLGWLRRPVHVITVNDYLAQRDAEGRSPIYRRCGLTCAAVVHELEGVDRLNAYRSSILYTTQKELVADWLRDQLRLGRIADPVSTRWKRWGRDESPDHQVLVPGLHVAVVDEVDSVLIDEAVTPLIIAQPRGEDAQARMYLEARDLSRELMPKVDFHVQPAQRKVELTGTGRQRLRRIIEQRELDGIWRAPRRGAELVEQALVAQHCYHEGQQYQIVEDQVVIVDEFTGRFMHDRQWQHGLHQAVEAKHNVVITADRDTLASLSFQRFFQMYDHLSGMTGTAADARPEMETTYGLPVRVIPTHRPVIRQTWPTQIFASAAHKWQAVLEQVRSLHQQGRPVLVGTRSIEASQHLSALLDQAALEHQVLNAVHHEEEAAIVARAGQAGAITVATNMAGRGTDIMLGKGVAKRGGLHVILTERHAARRIDRQLFGRAGRQGDPGSAQAVLSLDDEIVMKFTPSWAASLRRMYRHRSDPLPAWIERVFDLAQQRAQRRAMQARQQVLKHESRLDQSLPGG